VCVCVCDNVLVNGTSDTRTHCRVYSRFPAVDTTVQPTFCEKKSVTMTCYSDSAYRRKNVFNVFFRQAFLRFLSFCFYFDVFTSVVLHTPRR